MCVLYYNSLQAQRRRLMSMYKMKLGEWQQVGGEVNEEAVVWGGGE